eukprot:COSAG02_NODE_356_length_23978_cov_7.868504_20_plen_54_part_00
MVSRRCGMLITLMAAVAQSTAAARAPAAKRVMLWTTDDAANTNSASIECHLYS